MASACSYSPSCLAGPTVQETPPSKEAPPTPVLYSASASVSAASDRAPPRFSDFVSDDELSTLSKGLIPANTSRNTKWVLKTFEEWRNARNLNFPQNPVPENLFLCTDPAVLSVNLVENKPFFDF